MPRRAGKQLDLFVTKRKRKRKDTGERVGGSAPNANAYLPHVARPPHKAAHPVHITMRRVALGPSFRSERVYGAIRAVIAGAKRNGVRLLHYSVQDNHLHLMVEGRDSADLSNQMRTLFSRIAFAVNAVARRHGKLFRDRHHRHELAKPSEVRNALVYILFNDRKHRGATAATAATTGPGMALRAGAAAAGMTTRGPALDPCSSARWFADWAPWDRPPKEALAAGEAAPTSTPGTWLAGFGWHGGDQAKLIRFSESPRVPTARGPRRSPRVAT